MWRCPRYNQFYNIEGKITDADWLRQRAFFLNFLSNEGKITDSWLAKRQKYSHLIGWARERAICILQASWKAVLKRKADFELDFELLNTGISFQSLNLTELVGKNGMEIGW